MCTCSSCRVVLPRGREIGNSMRVLLSALALIGCAVHPQNDSVYGFLPPGPLLGSPDISANSSAPDARARTLESFRTPKTLALCKMGLGDPPGSTDSFFAEIATRYSRALDGVAPNSPRVEPPHACSSWKWQVLHSLQCRVRRGGRVRSLCWAYVPTLRQALS